MRMLCPARVFCGGCIRREREISWDVVLPEFGLEVTVIGALDLAGLHKDLRRCAVHAFLEAFAGVSVRHCCMRDESVPVHDMIASFPDDQNSRVVWFI